MPTVTPFLWYDADLEEPIAYYEAIFPDLVVLHRGPGPDGTTFNATIEIYGQKLIMLNGGPQHAGFQESFSLLVSVESQGEVDDLWTQLTQDGGEEGRCGWLKDRYGLSWQIIPEQLGSLIGGDDPVRSQQALEAMFQMNKLDIATLRAAYDR